MEVFKIEHTCGPRPIEIPVHSVHDGVGKCPRCGGQLAIDWGAARAEAVATMPATPRLPLHPAEALTRAYRKELARIELVYGVPARL